MTRKKYRPWQVDQSFLLPPSMKDWLPEGHLAWFIREVVEQLDLSTIDAALQSKDPRGNRPFDPRMMVALLLYGWCVGVRSSRAIARLTWNDVAFRVLAGDQHPVYSTLIHFRADHADALAGLFVQVLEIARKAGLVALHHVAVDGTKVQAAASKHKAMSYGRMRVARKKLEDEVSAILAEAERVDQEEDALYGTDNNGDVVPEELRRRETRLARIKQAMAELEEEARLARAEDLRALAANNREKAETQDDPAERGRADKRATKQQEQADELDPPDDEPPSSDVADLPLFQTATGLPKHKPKRTPAGKPKPKAQRNFTDPDSRIMERGGAFLQGYNCQLAVDAAHQVIVAHGVTNLAPDNGNLVPMLRLTRENTGQSPTHVTADSGYWADDVESRCRELGTEAWVATGRLKHGSQHPPTDNPIPDDLTPRPRMKARLNTTEGRALYKRRKAIVEPVNGQIKDARGLRRFLRRGLEAVSQDWALEATCHNLMKVYRYGWQDPDPDPDPATG